MQTAILQTETELARIAAAEAAAVLKRAIEKHGHTTFIAATGASQIEFLKVLTADRSIDWSKATMFHLDEYVDLPESHPASFRKYLKEKIIDIIHPGQYFLIEGDAPDHRAEVARMNKLISNYTVDLALVGVGENGHLAFNDPPADFKTTDPYIIVDLDSACRQQQVGEGWFADVTEVPVQAVSMSIKQILKADTIIVIVPHTRKAKAVATCFGTAEVSNLYPASILKQHQNTLLYLDEESAQLLDR